MANQLTDRSPITDQPITNIQYPISSTHYRRAHPNLPTIFILHGWGSSSERWTGVIEQLSRAGYDVLAPDLPGFGGSPPPDAPWNVEEYAAWADAFLQSLAVCPLLVVGHSFGGRVAIRLLQQRPDVARGLVLCASSGLKHPKTLKQRIANFAAKTGKRLFSFSPLAPLQNFARRALYRSIGEYDYYRTSGIMRETFQLVNEHDIAPVLETFTHPTFIIWGDQDKVTPLADAHRFHSLIPDSRLEILPGAGHRLPYEQTEAFCELVVGFAKEFETQRNS
ncbi:MAG: alpha/beta hydrolase [Anaerolineales bacterium]